MTTLYNPDKDDDESRRPIGFGVVPVEILRQIIKARDYGNKNGVSLDAWKTEDESKYLDDTLHHLHEYISGKFINPKSGLTHLAHAACNIALLIEKDKVNNKK